jgi:AcrR family transcriptional regulator
MGSEPSARSVPPSVRMPDVSKLPPGPGMAAQDVAAHQLARIYDATVGIVAEDGYKALKVRDVVRYAEVSTRAFYELFRSKEDCFLQTYDLISRRAGRRIIAAQASEPDWRKRSQLAVEEFVQTLGSNPKEARLALVEAYAAGVEFLEHAWKTEQIFGEMVTDTFARSPSGLVMPPLIVEGIVGGFIHVARDRLRTGKTAQLEGESEELVGWSLSLADPLSAELTDLDRDSMWRDSALEPTPTPSADDASQPGKIGDRALILKATAEMAAEKGFARLTAPRIRATARVSRRKFEAYFDDVEDCYLAAVDQFAGEALAHAARAQSIARSQAGGVYRAIVALCEHIAADPFLARVCLDNDFPPGARGVTSRQRLVVALAEMLKNGVPAMSQTVNEATAGALWSLFHHHVIRSRVPNDAISATLSYLALAPTIGAPAALAAVRGEQRQ